MAKLPMLLAILLVIISVNGFSEESFNNTKPVIFRTSPANTSDSGSSESRLGVEIAHTSAVFGPDNDAPKKVVSSQGYQLEKIDDSTSEEAQERSSSNHDAHATQKASERQLTVWPSASPEDSPPFIDQYLHQEGYEDNSAREEINNDYIPKGKLSYEDFSGKSDLSKVRDSFVGKEVNGHKSHQAEAYPSSNPLESKYKHEFDSPLKYINSPILLKQANLPLHEPGHLSHPHLDHHEEIGGHTAGYGHGFHHHQQKLKSKPLKPSIVYRDPTDSFDHLDKIRTLDKDQHEKDPHHPYGHHGKEKGHDYDSYTHGKASFKPEYYDQTKTPECAHKNKYIYNLTFCLDDPHYPTETIIWALKEEGPHAKKLLSDVTYQSADNLVTGLTRAEEEGYTYKHYFGASHAQNEHLDKYKPPYQGYTYSTDYFKKGGYICPSDIYYARPKRAMNTYGKWKVIINVDHVPDHGYEKHGHGHHHHHSKPPVDIGHGIYGKDHYDKTHLHDPHHHDKHHLHEPHHHGKHLAHHEGPHHHYEGPHHNDKHQTHHEDPHHNSHGLNHNSHHEQHGYGGDSYSPHHSIKKREYKEKKSYTQTLRLEQCIYSNAPCSYVDSHYHSKCIQKHNFVRLVAWTHDEGVHVDTFKMPIACSCHVSQPIHFYHESHEHKHGHVNYHHGHQQPHHLESHELKKLY